MVDFAAHTANIIARLGAPVSITPAGQATRLVNGVFSADPAAAFGLIDGYKPTVRLTTAAAAGLKVGDPVAIGDASYTAYQLRHDAAAGDVLVELEAV